jgi:hypothetical protein
VAGTYWGLMAKGKQQVIIKMHNYIQIIILKKLQIKILNTVPAELFQLSHFYGFCKFSFV